MINGSLWLFSIDETLGELFPDLDPIMSGWSCGQKEKAKVRISLFKNALDKVAPIFLSTD